VPPYRLLHPNCRTGNRIKQLTDLEFIVWLAYMLSADDFGVCPASASKLQGDDPRLDGKPKKQIERAIETLVRTGLLCDFEDGGTKYLYQKDWRDYQAFQYPSTKTIYPPIPSLLLIECSQETIWLFLENHPKVIGKPYIDADLLPTRSKTRSKSSLEKENVSFEEFWLSYPRKVGKGAALRKWEQINPDATLVRAIIASVRQHSESRDWLKDDGQYIPHPTTFLNQTRWKDEVVTEIDSTAAVKAAFMKAVGGSHGQ
jgi:hypothetical protein